MKAVRLIIMSALFALSANAQVGVKTNLLYDAALTPNIGIEFGLAPK